MNRVRGLASSMVAAAIALAAIPPAHADWYGGLWAGWSRSPTASLARDLPYDGPASPPFVVRSAWQDEERGSWRVLVGGRLTPRISVEAHYSDLGATTFGYEGIHSSPASPALHTVEGHSVRRAVTAWGVDLVGRHPVADGWELFAGLGASRVEVTLDDDFTIRSLFGESNGSIRVRSRSTVVHGLAGVAWRPAPSWDLRLAVDYLGKTGEPYQQSSPERHTGESSRATVWLGLLRSF